MFGPPPPPVNVRAVMRDGTTIPIEFVFSHIDEDGQRVWTRVRPEKLDVSQVTTILAEMIPGRTAIEL